MKLLERNVPIDILLTDVVLPGILRGSSLAHRAKALRPNLVVASMSGYPEGALSHNRSLPTEVTLLGKSFRMEELENQLRIALDRAEG